MISEASAAIKIFEVLISSLFDAVFSSVELFVESVSPEEKTGDGSTGELLFMSDRVFVSSVVFAFILFETVPLLFCLSKVFVCWFCAFLLTAALFVVCVETLF